MGTTTIDLLDVHSVRRALDRIYESQRLVFSPGKLETMQAVTLATIANRLDAYKGNEITFFEYGGILKMIKDCEMLASHPIMGIYTNGIVSLSYFEWKRLIK